MRSFKKFITDVEPGCRVRNNNAECEHYKSTGIVRDIKKIQDTFNSSNEIGDEVEYECDCDGPTWKKGDVLRKTKDQLEKI